MSEPIVIIDNKTAGLIQKGQRWVGKATFVGRVPTVAGVVKILDKKRNFIAKAFCSPRSKIFMRVLTLKDEVIDKKYWRKKIEAAFGKRKCLEKTTDAYRVVFAESDEMPSIIVDRYNDIWTIQITSEAAEKIKKDIIDIIIEDYRPISIIEKNNILMRKEEGLPLVEEVVYGNKFITEIREGSEHFELDVLHGQKTGAYLDYRALRLKAREFAKGDCLDAFCYEGWFTCHIAGNANRVIAVDSSLGAIEVAKKNAALNRHDNVEFIKVDVFEYLKKCDLKFDFVHLDPPSFVKTRKLIVPALKGYKKLLLDALRLIKNDGSIMVSSCSHHISERMLQEVVEESIKEAGFSGKKIFFGTQDKDHPLLSGFAEALYLKAVVFLATKAPRHEKNNKSS